MRVLVQMKSTKFRKTSLLIAVKTDTIYLKFFQVWDRMKYSGLFDRQIVSKEDDENPNIVMNHLDPLENSLKE